MKVSVKRFRLVVAGLFLFAVISVTGLSIHMILATNDYVPYVNYECNDYSSTLYINYEHRAYYYAPQNYFTYDNFYLHNDYNHYHIGNMPRLYYSYLYDSIIQNEHAYSYALLYVIDSMNAYYAGVNADESYCDVYIQPAIVWGNVTQTGYLHVGDLTRLAQHLVGVPGMELPDCALYLADVDRDGRITVADLILIAQYLAAPYTVVLGVPQ